MSATVPRSQTVELRSHPVPLHGQHPQLRVRASGDIHSLIFEAYWQSSFLAMSEDELRELRDAIDTVLAHGGEDGE